MSAPLSLDLRQRATQSYLNGEGTQKEIAQRFCISVRTLSTWLMLLQAGESLSPLLYCLIQVAVLTPSSRTNIAMHSNTGFRSTMT